jgi:hypothetical protein
VYSFQDVAEAMVVHEALQRGVRHAGIKTAISVLGSVALVTTLSHTPKT